MVRVPEERGEGRRFTGPSVRARRLLRFHSRRLERNPLGDPATRTVALSLPPSAIDEGVPLLVVLPGYGGTGWLEAQTEPFLGENLFRRFERMVALGRCPPAVMLMPDAQTSLGTSQYVNSSATGAYASYLVEELLPWARRRFKTGPTVLAGHSSGGFGALHLALEYPGRFAAVGSSAGDMGFDQLYLGAFPAAARHLRLRGGPEPFLREVFEEPSRLGGATSPAAVAFLLLALSACYSPRDAEPGAFDLPFEVGTAELVPAAWERWLALDPLRRLANPGDRAALGRLRGLFLNAGAKDEWCLDVHSRRFEAIAARHRLPVVYHESGGGHQPKGPLLEELFVSLLAAVTPSRGRPLTPAPADPGRAPAPAAGGRGAGRSAVRGRSRARRR